MAYVLIQFTTDDPDSPAVDDLVTALEHLVPYVLDNVEIKRG